MNNILKRTVSSVLAFTVALSSVQLYGTTAHAAVASGVKGDANADGVVTEADLAIYESYLLGNTEIADDILEDMDIDYGNTYWYVKVNGNDYAAVRNYLEGCTQTIEPSGHIDYKNEGGILSTTLYAGYYSSNAVYIAETDSLTNSSTEHEITEIIWDGGKPDWATEVEIEGEPYIECTPDEADVGTYNMLIVGKSLSGKYHAIANGIEVCLPDYKATTEDGNILYENGACILIGPGTYNITSSVTDASDMIMIADIGQSGKYIINLNGMNINCGDTDTPGDFIQAVSYESGMPTMDIDIVLSGSNVIRNADVDLYTEGEVNIYGDDDDTLSLLGNSSVRVRALNVNGGKVTVKTNYYHAMGAEQLTMMGGSLDLSFSPVEGQQWNTSNTSLTGIGLRCDEIIIRRGDLLLSGNDGAVQGMYSTPKFYVSPLYCDIDVEVSDDGTTYTAIEGSPFSDPDNSPSAYTDAVGAGAPDNSVDISNHITNKNSIKIVTGHTYSYKVTIDAGERGNVTYEDDTANQKSFWVAGGEKLPEGITLTADEGWEIDSITASINGGSAVNVTDIFDVVISGDTVINVTTKDVKAPVINGITDGSNYCGTITFTVTDDSDVSVTINGEVAQPDANGVYTIVGNTSAYGIRATDAFGNETLYSITVYESHPSVSNHQDNGDGTHTGVCDFCNENVIEDHNFGDWYSTGETSHEQVCEDCGYTEIGGHIMGDWESNNGETHGRECSVCHYLENSGHNFGEWSDCYNTDTHIRICEDCGYIDEAEHNFSEWTEEENTGKHKRECTDCGHTEESDHDFGEWTDNHQSGKCERECETCGYVEEADHIFGEWTDNHQSGKHERECETCGHVEESDHDFGEWTDNHQSGKCERECETCGHVDEAEHDFGDWEDIPESGQHKRECENCGHTETGDHNLNDWTPHVASDTHRAYCLDCGLLVAEPHSMGECEEYDDLQHIRRCEDCAFFLIGDHTYGEWRDNAETGKHERECEGCGHVEEAEHNMEEYSEYDTSTHIRFCTDCGSYYEMEAHIYGDWEEIANTNNHKHECLICGYTEYRSHNYGDWTNNTETGKCERECEDCGRVQENDHNFDEWTNDPDTDKHERICRNCGHTEEAEHNYSDWENDNESGKHIRMCLDCFHIEEAEHRLVQRDPSSLTQHMVLCEDCDYYEFEDHSFDEWTHNNAYTHKHTCTLCGHEATEDHDYTGWTHDPETNKHRGECATCGHIEESEHVFGEWADNHETGKCERECEICGHIEEAEHIFGDWADNHETGKCERECETCGHIEEAEHVFSEWVDNDDTNKHEKECEVCGHRVSEDHKFDNAVNIGNSQHKLTCSVCDSEMTEACHGVWETVKDASCTEEGMEEMICDVCGEKHTRSIEKLPHEFVNGRCSSCYMEDPAIGDSSTNPPTGVGFGAGLVALIPAAATVFFARPKAKKKSR